jgi:hypothetical protein
MVTEDKEKLTEENYYYSFFKFNDRQAGVSLIFSPEEEHYLYNSYCLETKRLNEIFSVESEFLSEAIDLINNEFGGWELVSLKEKQSGCSTCVAK